MEDIADFWQDQSTFIEENLVKEKLDEFRNTDDQMLELGMNWLVFGKLSVVAERIMQENEDIVSDLYMTPIPPDPTRKALIMNNANQTTSSIKELFKNRKMRSNLLQNATETALEMIRKAYYVKIKEDQLRWNEIKEISTTTPDGPGPKRDGSDDESDEVD